MIQVSRKILYFLAVVIVISCKSNQTTTKPTQINSEPNGAYVKSRVKFKGTLSASEYQELKSQLEKELNTTIPEGKTVLINYDQGAENCITIKFKDKYIYGGIKLSRELTLDNNTLGFFVYAQNTFSKELFSKYPIYKMDSGFFYENIFTLHENCSAFYILKANGNFYKYYGEDYLSDVRDILESKK